MSWPNSGFSVHNRTTFFDGVLERIGVKGFSTPDFQLTSAGNSVDLRTDFEAIVDGTKR